MLLRSIFSPAAAREQLEVKVELWLDERVAPTLPTRAPKDDATLVRQLIDGLNAAASSMEMTLHKATDELRAAVSDTKAPLAAFQKTVDGFNEGVRDFSEFNYNLRGTVERMDVSVRDLVGGLREVSRELERSRK
jgi:hypothetical protein